MSKSTASNEINQARARRGLRLTFNTRGASRAKQSFKDECDINNIMKKFEKTGVIEHVKQHGAKYGNFLASPQDYHSALNQVVQADRMFMSLPAKVRQAFDNDPGQLLAAVDAARNGDADQLDRLTRLGLAKPAEPAKPAETPSGVRQGAAGEPGKEPAVPETPPPGKASSKA